MKTLSQNRKIAISTLAVFLASFSFMVVFLGGEGKNPDHIKTDVLGSVEDNGIVFSSDAEGNFLGSSESFCRIIGKNCTMIKNYKLFDSINSEDLSEFASVHAKLIQSGEGAQGLGPFRFIDKDGNFSILLLDAMPKKDAGRVEKIIFHARDLTDHFENLRKEKKEEAPEDPGSRDSNWLEKFHPKNPPKLLVEKA